MATSATPDGHKPYRFSTVIRYLKRCRPYLALGGVAIILTNLLALTIPYITKLIFDLLEKGGSSRQILRLDLLIISLAILAGLFRFFVRRTIIWASRHIEYDLRGELFAHPLKLSPSYYHQTRTSSAAIDLCWLACERLDGFWEFYLQPWDTAAAKLIVEEAGGAVSRINGKRYSIFAPDVLATNGHLHKAMMSALTEKTS